MKKFGKVLCILLAMVIMFGVTGCGKTEVTNEGTTQLTWYIPCDNQPDHDMVVSEVNKIAEAEIGAQLDLKFIDLGSYNERMKMNMASQAEFDLMWVGYANDYKKAVDNGGIIAIGKMLENTPKLKESIPDYFWNASVYDGDIYAVPCVQIAATSYIFCIKKDLVEKYNIDVSAIKKTDDIEPILELIKKNEPNLYPLQPKYGPLLWTFDKYQVLGGTFLAVAKDDPNGKVINLLDTPEYQKGIKKLREWYEKGYIRSDVASNTSESVDFNQGKYGVCIQVAKPGVEQSFYASYGYEIVCAEFTESFFDGSGVLQTMNAVSATSKVPEKALEFLELVNTNKEVHNLLSFGIKDKHYTINENGKATYIGNSGWAPKADWMFGNQFNSILLDGQLDDVWEQTEKINDSAKKALLLGFSFNTGNCARELANVSSVVDEYNNGMRYGYNDPANYLDEYIKKLETAGINKIHEDMQSQVDEFIASKNK